LAIKLPSSSYFFLLVLILQSTLAIKDHLSSKDKASLSTAGGHVELCTGKMAHEKLWPKAAKWIVAIDCNKNQEYSATH